MSDISSRLKFLYSLQKFGIKLGLQNIRVLVRELGHPERQYPCIHIAGTNGKGSTAAMIASVLTASGYRTGLYTSPHLVSFNERIRVNGRKISDEAVVEYTKMLKPLILTTRATFFEATTAMAFQYFADQKIDVAVIETGLGGRYDATNVVTPLLSIITSISLDHTDHLGNTIESIAYQKGGIIKSGVPCLSGVDDRRAITVLKRIAEEKRAMFIQSIRNGEVTLKKNSFSKSVCDIQTRQKVYKNIVLSLCGVHQTHNLLLSLLAIEYLKGKCSFDKIVDRSLRRGLGNVKQYTGFRGRMDVLQQQPLIIADAAHNPNGTERLAHSLHNLVHGKVLLLFGVMQDKDYRSMIRQLKPMVRAAITVQPRIERALPATLLAKEFHHIGIPALSCGTARQGLVLAKNEGRPHEPILVTGSQFLLGEILKELNIVP